MPAASSNQRAIRAALGLVILHAYFYVFMEWLFFVTKPSALSLLTWLEKLRTLFVAGGVFAAVSLAPTLPTLAAAWTPFKRRWAAVSLAPAFILSVNALLLFDNFTYTVFGFGIVGAKGWLRLPYLAGFLAFWGFAARGMSLRLAKKRPPALTRVAPALLTLSLAAFLLEPSARNPVPALSAPSARPNIVILSGDGLSANYLSLYDAKYDDTPFLKKLAEESLLAENAFSNASSTTASTASILTGKTPLEMQVFRYPDILAGESAYQHLPGLLKQARYRAAEIGVSHYVDARELNLLGGFDWVNGETLIQPFFLTLQKALGGSVSAHFARTLYERASERLASVFFAAKMSDPIKEVERRQEGISDAQRLQQLFRLLDDSEQPLFAFVHLMDTHGPRFSFSQRIFSSEADAQDWDKERYLDAIASFDKNVERVYNHLAETGKLEDTILVVVTDHGFMYVVNQRVPLLIRFPRGEYAGRRKNNVQLIDLPVTLLDYLKMPKPNWMSGASFLTEEPPPERRILSVTAGSPKKLQPPFYQIKSVQVLVCQRWYALNVQENSFTFGSARGHTAPCEASPPPEEEIRASIVSLLEENGYAVNSLKP